MESSHARDDLLQNLIRVPHRKVTLILKAYQEALLSDPAFGMKAMAYIALTSKIRDLQDVAIVTLLTAPAAESWGPACREAGRCLLLGSTIYDDVAPAPLPGLPPFRILRVWSHLMSPWHVIHEGEVEATFTNRSAAERKIPRIANRLKISPDGLRIDFYRGHKRPSRLLRNLMVDWFQALEVNPRRADGVVLQNRKGMLHVWKYYRFSAGMFPYLHAILFSKSPPRDSRVAVLKRIAASTSPQEQAALAMQYRIPFDVLLSITGRLHPVVAIAAIDVMTPAQALNSIAWVTEAGLLAVPEVRKAFEAKVAAATASAASAVHRRSAQSTDAGVEAARHQAIEKAVANDAQISGNVLYLVDRSGSMESAIETACEFAARTAARTPSRKIVAFDEYAHEIRISHSETYQAHRTAFGQERAGGRTSMAAGLRLALQGEFVPDRIVIFTDGGENVGDFAAIYGQLTKDHNHEPQLILVLVPGEKDVLSARLQQAGIRFVTFRASRNDYSAFDQIVGLLDTPVGISLIEQIYKSDLPHRACWAAR